MEDSYTVHRRRKAAARKREKTPEPSSRSLVLETSEDEEEARRARMEKMAEDTERMEEMEREKREEELRGDAKKKEEEQRRRDLEEERKRAEKKREGIERRQKEGRQQENEGERSKEEKTAAAKEIKNIPADPTDVDAGNEKKAVEEQKVKKVIEPSDKTDEDTSRKEASGVNVKDDLEDINEISKAMEVKKTERRVKKRSKERLERLNRSTDSSDERNENSPRRTKSPEAGRTRLKKSSSRSRTSDPEGTIKRSSSGHKLEEKEERRGSRRYSYPEDTDEEPKIRRSETFPQKSAEETAIKRSASDVKKQIIPLSNDSLIEDFEKAQREYLLRERSILDPDYMEDFQDAKSEGVTLRRRKKGVTDAEYYSSKPKFSSDEKVSAKSPPEESWFSWLPFFSRKTARADREYGGAENQRNLEETALTDDAATREEEIPKKATWMDLFRALRLIVAEFRAFMEQNAGETKVIRGMMYRCMVELTLVLIYCGLGAFVFRFTEGAFETFYKCGVKRVKRDFLDSLWNYSHNLREDDWKSMARKKLMEFEEQLHTAHEAGVHSYSGQRSWSFLNAVVYCLTVITTIGYGHISPSTTTGRAITIVYAIFGIPMFLIILADFGKLFTRGIKFLWAFVRRVYYTGSCRKVRRTVPVQEVMKGVQLVYDLATFRRPSQNPEDIEEMQRQAQQQQPVLNLDGNVPDTPGTPAMSTFAIDDEFNLPISVAIFILLGYIFIGAALYYIWEDWGFFESFYFVFISMSTIGFGDYVPKHPIYMMCSIIYLVFGLALTSMCINVVQVMLSDSFRQASQKIGATIGFEIAEDDNSVKPAIPPTVEIADVHATVKESESVEKIAPKAKQEDVDL